MGKASVFGAALIVMAVCAVSRVARAQATPPTTCPTNYTCAYHSSSTQALSGSAADGQPQSRAGFMKFDGAGNITGVLSGNLNGKVVLNTPISGKCTSGTSATLGTLAFNAGLGGNPVELAFVTRPDGNKIDLLLAGSMLANDTRVLIGVCYGD